MRDRPTVIYLLLISIFLLSMMALMISAETRANTDISAKAYALYNPDTDTFVSSNNINLKLPMASTTKILTALIAIERLNLEETISVPSEAVGIEGSSVYLSAGDLISVRDLIYSVLLQSANDAAVVLALRMGDSIEGFADIMNKRAAEIGALDSNFENPHGLDSDDHYTTAKDLALISAAALENDIFREISSTYKYSFSIGDKKRTVVNHNKLLTQYDGCIGVKTGYTKKCGRCLVTAATRDGITLIAVTLSDPQDWRDHKNLLDAGFNKLEKINLLSEIDMPNALPVIRGDKERIRIGLKSSDKYLIKYKDTARLQYDVKLVPYVTKNLSAGDSIGKLILKTDNTTKEIDIIALEDVKITKTNFLFQNRS